MKRIKVIYLGYDITTVYLINSNSQFELMAVAVIPEFKKMVTLNAIDHLFKFTYRLKSINKFFIVQKILVFFILNLRCFLSPLYKKYARYLKYIIDNNVSIIEENEILIKEFHPDIIIVNNWWKISNTILNSAKYGCINIHPSYLPQYRGSVPTLWSLKNKDTYSAVSLFLLNDIIDTGKIISQHKFIIKPQDNAIDIEKKIESILVRYLLEDVVKYMSGELKPKPQDKTAGSYTAKYYDYMLINFKSEKASDIMNKVILYPYLNPVDNCYFTLNKTNILVSNTKESFLNLQPGEMKRKGLSIHVGCSDNHCLSFKLFRDIKFIQSFYVILNSNG